MRIVVFQVALNILIATRDGRNRVRGDNKGGTGFVDVINLILSLSLCLSVLPPFKSHVLMKHRSEVVARSGCCFSSLATFRSFHF